MLTPPILFESERLRFRDFSLDDADACWAMWGDPEVMHFLGGVKEKNVAEMRDVTLVRVTTKYAAIRARGEPYGGFALIAKDGGALIGCGLLKRMPDGDSVDTDDVEIGWHLMRRESGLILVASGLVAALSGLWMVQRYPPINFDGPILYVIRLVVGSAMALFLCLGVAAILRRDIPAHRAWMMRSYALDLGAGTQVFTHLPLLVVTPGKLTRALAMGAGWAINIAVAEWLIRRASSARRAFSGAPTLRA